MTTRNAVATAEGAIAEAVLHSDGTLHGAACLVIGFGRVGLALAQRLRGLSAHVTVAARLWRRGRRQRRWASDPTRPASMRTDGLFLCVQHRPRAGAAGAPDGLPASGLSADGAGVRARRI